MPSYAVRHSAVADDDLLLNLVAINTCSELMQTI